MDSNAPSETAEYFVTCRDVVDPDYNICSQNQEAPWKSQANSESVATSSWLTPPEESTEMASCDAQTTSLNLPPLTLNVEDSINSSEVESSDNGWNVPAEVANEMIDLFFVHIQHWLPLLHRPLFQERFTGFDVPTRKLMSRSKTSPDAAFMINSMFALTARFSNAAFFDNLPALDRGQAFADEAAIIKDGIIKTIKEPTLDFVKGCILLAYHYFTSGEMAPGSLITSVCVRFAYDLGLNDVDGNQPHDDGTHDCEDLGDSDAWVRKEELRRLWWSIWELDIFVATLSRQPYTIERSEMKVFLPVSDQQWFSGNPIRSSLLDHEPNTMWHSLSVSPNQNPRAWYLTSNFLMSCIALAGRRQSQVSRIKKAELQSALCCLKLALPTNFQLQSLYINEENFVAGNWIISTHLMILACETLFERLACLQPVEEDSPVTEQTIAPTGTRIRSYLVNIVQKWPSEYIPLSNPIMSCCVIVPGGIYAQPPDPVPHCREISKLILKHYSRYWKLGLCGLRLLAATRQGSMCLKPSDSGPKERDMMKRFSILLPPEIHKEASQGSPGGVHHQGFNTIGLGLEIFSTSELDDFYTADVFQWPLEMWTSSGDLGYLDMSTK